MHFKIQGSFNYDDTDTLERDAPSEEDIEEAPDVDISDDDEDVDDEYLADVYDSDSSLYDNAPRYSVEAFVNPVYNMEDLNIVEPEDTPDKDISTEEESQEPDMGDFNNLEHSGSSSSSEMSGDYDEWEIVETNKELEDAKKISESLDSSQQGTSDNLNEENKNQLGALINQEITTTNNTERANLNYSLQGASQNSANEDLNNAQQGSLSNKDISTLNDIEGTNLNSAQQGANYNSDNEDLNSAQQGVTCNKETNTPSDIEKENLNSTQQSELCNSDEGNLNFDVVQGTSSNLETNTSNNINPNLINSNFTKCMFVTCDNECIEPIAISTPSFGTHNIYYGPQNSDFETQVSPASVKSKNRSPSSSGYTSPYPPNNGAQGDAGNMQTANASGSVDYESSENTSTSPVSNTMFSSTRQATGNPAYATLHLLPRDTFLNKSGYPSSHYHCCPAGRCYPGPYSPIFTDLNNRTYRELYSANSYGPDYSGYTGPRFGNYRATNNHGFLALASRNHPIYNNPPHKNASYGMPQQSNHDASDNLSRTTQSTKSTPGASAGGAADESAYEATNPSGYNTSTSFVQSDQLSPGQGASVTSAYLGPHSYNYDNQYSPNYIASNSSSHAEHYSQFSVPSPGYPAPEYSDIPDGSPGTSSGYSASVRHEPTCNSSNDRAPQGSSYNVSEHLASKTTQSTNYVASSALADGTVDAYEAPNASSYAISTLFDQNDKLFPRQPTAEPQAYLGLNSYDYDDECSPNQSSSDVTLYSQYSAPTSGCPDNLDVSENVTSQSPITQAISNDEVSSSTASYNYGDLSTSYDGTPASNAPTFTNATDRTPQAHDTSGNLNSDTTGRKKPGWFFFTVYEGPNPISYNFPNTTGYDTSGMSGDSELGSSGGQRGRRLPLNSRPQSKSSPNSTRQHGRGSGDKHGQ